MSTRTRFLTLLLLAAACGDSSGPEVPEVVDIEFDGHYEGSWVLRVSDTVMTCDTTNIISCGGELLASFECPTVSEISATGDSTFTGTFSNDVSGCIGGPVDPLDTTQYLTLAPTASFVATARPLNPVNNNAVTAGFEAAIGAGDRAAYEALFGCTPSGDWFFNIRFWDGATKTFDASLVDIESPSTTTEGRAVCAGRHVLLHARVEAESYAGVW